MGEPTIGPDHQRVAFSLPDLKGIATMRIDGADRRVLTHGADMEPAWSPDGRTIYFTRLVRDWRVRACASIFAVPARGGPVRRITRGHHGGHSEAAPSPDGRLIALTETNSCEGGTATQRLRVFTADGRPSRELARLPHNDLVPDRFEYWGPSWSPDGTRLAFLGRTHLTVANRDGSGARRLIGWGGQDVHNVAAWSPNGAWIAWARPSPDDTSSEWSLLVVQPDGEELRRLVVDPDGLTIAGWLLR